MKYQPSDSPQKQLSRVVFLRFKTSNPEKPHSTDFEKMNECVQSMALLGEGWDVIAKFKHIDTEKLENIIISKGLGEIVEIIEAETLRSLPIEHLILRKSLCLYLIPVQPKQVEKVRNYLLGSEAIQIYESKHFYTFWSIFALDVVSQINNPMKDIRDGCPGAIREGKDIGIPIIEFRKTEEAPSVPLLGEIERMIRICKGKTYYWTPCIDVALLMLKEDVSVSKLMMKVKRNKSTYNKNTFQKCLQKLSLAGFAAIVVNSRSLEPVYTLNRDRFPLLYSYFRKEFG